MEFFRIDTSKVVSRYIGETEKNLQNLFDEIEERNSILFFDEAEAIFGKRTNIKDSHDKYANIELSYINQRMENFAGVILIGAKKRDNIDESFLRRLYYNIHFPKPSSPSRLKNLKINRSKRII
jgi:SpoVK/Ycf46/Vps4 family AAA+-type ATPase